MHISPYSRAPISVSTTDGKGTRRHVPTQGERTQPRAQKPTGRAQYRGERQEGRNPVQMHSAEEAGSDSSMSHRGGTGGPHSIYSHRFLPSACECGEAQGLAPERPRGRCPHGPRVLVAVWLCVCPLVTGCVGFFRGRREGVGVYYQMKRCASR